MGRVLRIDNKALKNRARVRKYRSWKKLKAIHEKYINDQISNEEEEDCSDEIVENISPNDGSNVDKATEISDKLKYWCVHHRITATAMNDLLAILQFVGLNFLPKDTRTLLGTPTNVPIQILTNGKLWYNGVKTCLENALDKISCNILITLDWNFDGLPIAKSSNMQFWPILASIRGMYTCI